MNTLKGFLVVAGMAISLLVTACASSPEPYEYRSENENKSGPGVLSGEDGVFTIYSGTPEVLQDKEPAAEEPAAKEQGAGETTPTPSDTQ